MAEALLRVEELQTHFGTPDGVVRAVEGLSFAVAPGETVSVQPWFVPYTGRYVFHCHNLEHGDKAMMLQLEVIR